MQVYKCEECTNIAEILQEGKGELVCCGTQMKVLEENLAGAAEKKHVPVIEKLGCGFRVKVGNVAHPMQEEHYVEWVEVITDNGGVYRKFLSPGTTPEVIFKTDAHTITARTYSNLHGLWTG